MKESNDINYSCSEIKEKNDLLKDTSLIKSFENKFVFLKEINVYIKEIEGRIFAFSKYIKIKQERALEELKKTQDETDKIDSEILFLGNEKKSEQLKALEEEKKELEDTLEYIEVKINEDNLNIDSINKAIQIEEISKIYEEKKAIRKEMVYYKNKIKNKVDENLNQIGYSLKVNYEKKIKKINSLVSRCDDKLKEYTNILNKIADREENIFYKLAEINNGFGKIEYIIQGYNELENKFNNRYVESLNRTIDYKYTEGFLNEIKENALTELKDLKKNIAQLKADIALYKKNASEINIVKLNYAIEENLLINQINTYNGDIDSINIKELTLKLNEIKDLYKKVSTGYNNTISSIENLESMLENTLKIQLEMESKIELLKELSQSYRKYKAALNNKEKLQRKMFYWDNEGIKARKKKYLIESLEKKTINEKLQYKNILHEENKKLKQVSDFNGKKTLNLSLEELEGTFEALSCNISINVKFYNRALNKTNEKYLKIEECIKNTENKYNIKQHEYKNNVYNTEKYNNLIKEKELLESDIHDSKMELVLLKSNLQIINNEISLVNNSDINNFKDGCYIDDLFMKRYQLIEYKELLEKRILQFDYVAKSLNRYGCIKTNKIYQIECNEDEVIQFKNQLLEEYDYYKKSKSMIMEEFSDIVKEGFLKY